jgi:hypothetical protein
MGISEAERRVEELDALVKCQLRLMRRLKTRGKDLTSAKIVFDSLRVSLFLAIQDLHRSGYRCGQDQAANAIAGSMSVHPQTNRGVVVIPKGKFQSYVAGLVGGGTSTKVFDDLADIAGEIGANGTAEKAGNSTGPEIRCDEKNLNESDFEFRPLTEDEKKEFVSSFNSGSRQLLAEPVGKQIRPGESAA